MEKVENRLIKFFDWMHIRLCIITTNKAETNKNFYSYPCITSFRYFHTSRKSFLDFMGDTQYSM